MSQPVQITLIICGTIIFVQIFGFLIIKSLWNKNNKPKVERDIERFGYCKSPTYPRAKIPGTDSANSLRNIKPPSTGSGIK